MLEDTKTTLRIAVAQSTVRHDPTNASLLHESGAEVRRLMKQAADAGARLVHFPEGAICSADKRIMSSLGTGEIGPSDWAKAQWSVLDEELDRIAAFSGELGIWTVIPSVHRLAAPSRPHNSIYIVSDQGKIVVRYDERMLSTTKITWMYTRIVFSQNR
jgi:predicted amidohydrolase